MDVIKRDCIQTIGDIDKLIDTTTFRYIMYQIYNIALDIAVVVSMYLMHKKKVQVSEEVMLMYGLVFFIATFFLISNRVKYYSSIKRILKENKKVIYSSKSVAIADNYIYIKCMRPIKLRILD